MTIVCTKCGRHIDLPPQGPVKPFDVCGGCGAYLPAQHLHIETKPGIRTLKLQRGDEVDVVDEGDKGRIRVREPSGKASAFLTAFELDKIADWCLDVARRLRARDGTPDPSPRAKPGSPVLCAGCLANRQTEERAARKLNRLSTAELAEYIITWLSERNGGELEEAFENMRVCDWHTLHDELEAILEHGGKPPNWTT